MICELTKC